jgi:phage/plasmid-associated DNA primase
VESIITFSKTWVDTTDMITVNYAKFIFSTNELPPTEDLTPAFFSRPIIVSFPNRFVGKNSDPFLIDQLATEEELTGLLRMVVERLPRVLKEGIRVKNDSLEETQKSYIMMSDPTKTFIEEAIESNSDSMISKSELYYIYVSFCRGKKLVPETEQSLSRKMTRHGFTHKQLSNSGPGGGRNYYWIGIGTKESYQ